MSRRFIKMDLLLEYLMRKHFKRRKFKSGDWRNLTTSPTLLIKEQEKPKSRNSMKKARGFVGKFPFEINEKNHNFNFVCSLPCNCFPLCKHNLSSMPRHVIIAPKHTDDVDSHRRCGELGGRKIIQFLFGELEKGKIAKIIYSFECRNGCGGEFNNT